MNRMFVATVLGTMAFAGAASGPIAPLAKAAQAAPKPPRQCFDASRIANWVSVDDKLVNLRVEGSRRFQLVLQGSCPLLSTHQTLAFETLGTGQICTGMDVTVVIPAGVAPLKCAVRTVRLLSPEEVAALPSRQRP